MAKSKFSPVVAAIVSADTAISSAFEKCRVAADLIFADFNTGANMAEEIERLVKLAKGLVATEGAVLKDDRNTWLHIRQHLLILADSEVMVEVKPATDKQSAIFKPAKHCKTAREVAAAAKTIREANGLADKRANNAPKAKEAAPAAPAAPATPNMKALLDIIMSDPAEFETLERYLKAKGFSLVPISVRAKTMVADKVAKAKAAPMVQQVQQAAQAAAH